MKNLAMLMVFFSLVLASCTEPNEAVTPSVSQVEKGDLRQIIVGDWQLSSVGKSVVRQSSGNNAGCGGDYSQSSHSYVDWSSPSEAQDLTFKQSGDYTKTMGYSTCVGKYAASQNSLSLTSECDAQKKDMNEFTKKTLVLVENGLFYKFEKK